jgi:hypothetical protein
MQAGRQKAVLPLIRKFNEHSERLLNSAMWAIRMIIKQTINRLSRGDNPPAKRRRLDNGEVIASPISIRRTHPFEIRTRIPRLTSMICMIQNLQTVSSWRCKNDSVTLKAAWRKIKLKNFCPRMYVAWTTRYSHQLIDLISTTRCLTQRWHFQRRSRA